MAPFAVGRIIAVALCAACVPLQCAAAERWIDEALLHDGRAIEVERSVSFNFGRGELSDALRKWPNQYSLTAKNPDTGKTIRWSGEQDFNPILLDFWGGTAHLVIVATDVFSDLKQYGCPEIPYVFLRYEEKGRRWLQVAAKEFPPKLLRANLSFRYDGTYMKDGKRQSKDDIDGQNALGERLSGGFTTRAIPTDFASWQSQYKNLYRVGHYRDGCRHTVPSNEDPSHPQSPGQPSQEVELEVLETKIYEPEWIIKGDGQIQSRDWNAIAFDNERNAKCRSFVRRVGEDSDRPELRGWLLFVNDPTGNKKARDSGALFCNTDALWFVDFAADPRRVIFTKFTISGDLVYRISFAKPDTPGGYLGHIMQPTFRSENGFLYFEWWNTNQSGWSRHIKRSMKVRIREPEPSEKAGIRK